MKTKETNNWGRMKSIMLLVAVFSFVGTLSVKAEDYGVYIAGTQITSSNYNKLANIDGVTVGTNGRIYYDSSSKTLYLKNVTISTKKVAIENIKCSNLNIVFEGYTGYDYNNGVSWITSSEKEAMILKIKTTIKSEGNGWGVVQSSASDDLSIEYNTKIYIENADISFSGEHCGINGNTNGHLYINNSEVKVFGGDDDPAVKDMKDLNVQEVSKLILYGNESSRTVSNVTSFGIEEDMTITSPTGASFSNGTFYKNGNVITGDIEFNTTAIPINNTNFPDNIFRPHVSSNFDTNGDGYLIKQEIRDAIAIAVSSKSISNLKGIEHFTSLQALACNNNNLTSIDISKNTLLTSLYCENNKLTSLNVSNNKQLQILSCSGNGSLTSLNLTNNTALQELYCKNCTNLTSITMGTHKSLKKVCLVDNNDLVDYNNDRICFSLNQYIVGKLPSVSSGSLYTTLWISKDDKKKAENKGWTVFSVGYEAYELNNTNFPDPNFRSYLSSSDWYKKGWVIVEKPTVINVEGKSITNLTGIGLFTNLYYLYCGNNRLTSLDVSKNTKLIEMGCEDNSISSLNISGCTSLSTLNCSNNSLSTLNVSPATSLRNLSCDGNNLSSLSVSSNSNMVILYCSNNRLSSLNVSSNNNLNELDCSYNQLTSLTLPKSDTKLTKIHCEGNKLKGSNMTNTVNSLPTIPSGTYANLFVSTSTNSEGNEMTQEQLAIANGKKWSVWQKESEQAWTPYVVSGIATGLEEIENGKWKIENSSESWYTIDGRKINGKPNAKGIYVKDGRKVVF